MPDLWDWFQDRPIESAKRELRASEERERTTEQRVDRVDRRIDRLSLLTRAMWELLRVKGGVSDNDLIAKIEEIDARDGVIDGKVTLPPHHCTSCGRVGGGLRERCLFCGEKFPEASPVEAP